MGTALVVLIAENDRDMRDYVRRCLEKHDVEIEEILEARDGQEGLEIARGRRIDLLITDGAMPRLDGFALCAAVRAELADRRTRVLVITGQFGPRDAERRARAVGADGLLLKPFNALALRAKIDEVLSDRAPPGGDNTSRPGSGLE
jgi:CheY-like chemotaxis protein